jgi:glycosyltransferase 2 family protein
MRSMIVRREQAPPPAPASENGSTIAGRLSKHRKRLVFVLKLAVSTVLIVWILRTEEITAILGALRRADTALLLAAFLIYAATYYVRALRWQLLLEANQVGAGLPFLIRSYLTSVFFSNFLPSTVGGDVVRVYDSWKAGTTKTAALTVILVDRFLGVVALLLFAAAALLLSPAARAEAGFVAPAVAMGTAAVLLGLWVLFLPGRGAIRLMERLVAGAGGRLRRVVDPLYTALHAFHGQQRVLGLTTLHSLLFQAMIILHYVLIARALGIGIPAAHFFWIIPVAVLVMMLPVSINAIGIREHVFIFFFAVYGIGGSLAVAFAWASYGVVLVLGLIGGVIYVLRR